MRRDHAVRFALLAGVVVIGYFAARRALSGAYRLVFGEQRFDAIDVGLRYLETTAWFAGETVYGALPHATYPPATYAILWPLMEPFSFEAARVIWFATTVAALLVVVWGLIRMLALNGWLERAVLALTVAAFYSVREGLQNGQLTPHVVAALLAAFVLFRERPVPMGAAFALTLVKPTLSLPFAWRFLTPRLRVVAMASGAVLYLVLTLFAVRYQAGSIISLHLDFVERALAGVRWGSTGSGAPLATTGYANVHDWLGFAGVPQWNALGSLAFMLFAGAWTFLFRHVGVILWLGVMAIIARLFVYHLIYDDFIVVIAIAATFCVARAEALPRGVQRAGLAVGLFALAAALLPSGWKLDYREAFILAQTLAWGSMLVVLTAAAEAARRRRIALDPATTGSWFTPISPPMPALSGAPARS